MSAPHITDDELRRALATYYELHPTRLGSYREQLLAAWEQESGHLMRRVLEEFVAHRAMRDRTQALRAQYAAAEVADG